MRIDYDDWLASPEGKEYIREQQEMAETRYAGATNGGHLG